MMRRIGVLCFALALAVGAIQVPACEYDPTTGPQPSGTLEGRVALADQSRLA